MIMNKARALIVKSGNALRAYHADNDDSLLISLKQWQSGYPRMEAPFRLKTLWQIRKGIFHSDSLHPYALKDLLDYRDHDRGDYIYQVDSTYRNSEEFRKRRKNSTLVEKPWRFIDSSINLLTQPEAGRLVMSQEKNSLAAYICQYYSGDYDSLLLPLYYGTLPSSKLTEQYHGYRKRIHPAGYAGLSLNIPLKKAAVLNPHPLMGIGIGAAWKSVEAHIGFAFTVVVPKKRILAKNYSDSLTYAKGFYGGNFWIEGKLSLVKSPYHEFLLAGGVSFMGYSNDTDALLYALFGLDYEEEDYDPKAIDLKTTAPFIGLEYRYYTKIIRQEYTALRASICFSRLNTHGGTDLKGPICNMSLLYGFR